MKKYKIEIKWAIIFVIASLLWMVLENALGWHDELIQKHPLYTLLFAVVAIAIYVFALIDKKKNFYNGKMNWTDGYQEMERRAAKLPHQINENDTDRCGVGRRPSAHGSDSAR